MAATPSTMVALGTPAPAFELPNTITGKIISLNELKGAKATLIMFICNHCPFVKHINKELVRLEEDFHAKGVAIIAISSNDVENYPEDSPEKMKETALSLGYKFPYLYDESQNVAKAYDAVCTPDFFLFNNKMKLVYRGQLDSSRPGNDVPVTGKDIRNAIKSILSGEDIFDDQKPSIGCNIKWKK